MKVLIYGINYAPELTGIGKYSSEMAEALVGMGHQVKVLTAPPYYPAWEISEGFSAYKYVGQQINGVEVLRCPLYVPAKPSTLKRIAHLASFACSSFFGLIKNIGFRPDVVILVEPPLFCAANTLLFSAVTGAKSILHIQDYEVDAMFGLGMAGQSKGLKKWVFAAESWVMRRFSRVSTISNSMVAMAKRKGVNEQNVMLFPNWADTNFVTPKTDGAAFREKFGVADDQVLVLYSGNMGLKQGLEMVIEAAKVTQNNPKIKYLMVGEGAAKPALEQLVMQYGLTNVQFHPLQAYAQLPQLLACADIHLVVQRLGAADVVLPSKLTNILSCGGHALITAEADTELGLLCQHYPGIATRIEPEQPARFVEAVLSLANDPKIKRVNQFAREYAVNNLEKTCVLQRFEQQLDELLAGSNHALLKD
ncbi:WcaI family glycosyltransferase [Agarivorans sp. MS3-6]